MPCYSRHSSETTTTTNTMKTLSNVEAVALAKAAKGKADEIIPGNYSGKFVVEIDYSLVKGADYEVAPTCNLLSKAVIAKALALMGFQADNFYAALEAAALEVLVNGGEVADEVLNPAVAAKLEELEAKVIAHLPRSHRSGATKVKATAKVVEAAVDGRVSVHGFSGVPEAVSAAA